MSTRTPTKLARTGLELAKQHGAVATAAAIRTYLTRRGQSTELPFVLAALRSLAQAEGVVTLETAQALPATAEQSLAASLPVRLGKSIEYRVNPALLGGFRLYQGSFVYDFSYQTTLKQLEQTLTEVAHA